MERIERERARQGNQLLPGARRKGAWTPEEQLFDTQADPFEFKNLAENPLLAETKARLEAALLPGWSSKTITSARMGRSPFCG